MKSKMLIVLMVTLGMMFVWNGAAFAGDGFQDNTCDLSSIPDPDVKSSVGVLVGKFTASNDLASFDHGNIHLKLEGSGDANENKEHLISTVFAYTNDLCGVNADDLALALKALPCRIGLAGKFGYTNDEVAVIRNVKIKETDFCGTEDQMISGNVQLLIMPGLITLEP